MSMNPGGYVEAVEAGSGWKVRGGGNVSYKAGDELEITSIPSNGLLNVRKGKGKPVFRISARQVRPQTRALGVAPEGMIDVHDPRIAWFFEDVSRLADRWSLCAVFDKFAEEMNFPGRERNFSIKAQVDDGIEITARVRARSRTLAEMRLHGVGAERLQHELEAGSSS